MDTETQNQPSTAGERQPDRTFTQADVDRIVGERLMREREKYSDYEALKKGAADAGAMQAQLAAAQQTATAAQIEAALVREAAGAGLTADRLAAALRLTEMGAIKVENGAVTGAKEALAKALTDYPFLAVPPAPPPAPPPVSTLTATGNPGAPVTFTKDVIAKMKPEEIEKNWDAIKSVLSGG